MRGLGRRRLTLRGSEDWRGGTSGVSSLDRDVVRLDGMQVLSPLRTCFDMMRERGLVEAVVVADAFAFQGVVDPVTMAVYAADRRRWPGVRLARTALNLSHPGARSPGESRLRMVVVLAGMPEPLVNVPVYDVSDHVLGVPDLTIHGRRQVGLEYDGAYHEQDDQQAADRRRENSLTALAGLPLLRYDRISVAQVAQRCLAAQEIARLAGTVVRNELVTADFVRPPRHLAWSL